MGGIKGRIFWGEGLPWTDVPEHTAFPYCILCTMLPLSDFRMLLFVCFSGGTTVLTTEKPTVIDSTIQSGIKKIKNTKNRVDFTCVSPLPPPPSSASRCFSVSISLKVLEERCHAASGLQAWAINIAFLHPHVYAAGNEVSFSISNCQMVTIPALDGRNWVTYFV